MACQVRRTILQEQKRTRIIITGTRTDVWVDSMAGSNKWFTVKRIKGVLDARQGKFLSRLATGTVPPNLSFLFDPLTA